MLLVCAVLCSAAFVDVHVGILCWVLGVPMLCTCWNRDNMEVS